MSARALMSSKLMKATAAMQKKHRPSGRVINRDFILAAIVIPNRLSLSQKLNKIQGVDR